MIRPGRLRGRREAISDKALVETYPALRPQQAPWRWQPVRVVMARRVARLAIDEEEATR